MGLRRRHMTIAAASLASLALAHVAIAIAASGPFAAPGGPLSGHAAPGPAGMLVAVSVVLCILLAAGLRLRMIARRASARGAAGRTPSSPHLARYAANAGRLWRHLFVGVVVLFLLLEGMEAGSAGASLPGLVVDLGADLGVVGPVIALVTLLTAATIALADWCHCALAKRLTRAAIVSSRAGLTRTATLRVADVPLVSALLAADSSGRSPPARTASPA